MDMAQLKENSAKIFFTVFPMEGHRTTENKKFSNRHRLCYASYKRQEPNSSFI